MSYLYPFESLKHFIYQLKQKLCLSQTRFCGTSVFIYYDQVAAP